MVSSIGLQSAEYHQLIAELRHPVPGATTLVTLSGGPTAARHEAVQQFAAALGRNLLRIDLASLVSQYIGETEKNLHQLFSRAEQQNAILFFDEADALFGRRTDVKDAHDRYAAAEVELLRRALELYPGIAVVLPTAPATTVALKGRANFRHVSLTWPPG